MKFTANTLKFMGLKADVVNETINSQITNTMDKLSIFLIQNGIVIINNAKAAIQLLQKGAIQIADSRYNGIEQYYNTIVALLDKYEHVVMTGEFNAARDYFDKNPIGNTDDFFLNLNLLSGFSSLLDDWEYKNNLDMEYVDKSDLEDDLQQITDDLIEQFEHVIETVTKAVNFANLWKTQYSFDSTTNIR